MSELDGIAVRIQGWLRALPDEAAPCGADLEYDNDFLAITKAAAGKPESQFGAAEPPNWRAVAELAEGMFERTRDLRLAILWLRANLHLHGYGALPVGLTLLNGLMEGHWDQLHPRPDPDDGDMYARVNAITFLRDPEGVIGDLRATRIVQDRAIGELTVRAVELALGLSPPREGESEMSKDPVSLMVRAAVEKTPALRAQCLDALALTRRLMSLVSDKFNRDDAPDLRPLYSLVNGVASLLPAEELADEAVANEGGADDGAPEGGGSGRTSGARRGLSGSVSSREEAVRAIDMVCEYLMQAEPSNPASLFLRRGRQLINHDFLQLMKVLAPDALSEVARVVGVDPESVESPEGP